MASLPEPTGAMMGVTGGGAFRADEQGYPDQVKLLCEVHLRTTLGLDDDDPIAFPSSAA